MRAWQPEAAASSSAPPAIVVLTARQPALLDAYALEVHCAYGPSCAAVTEGVWLAPGRGDAAVLSQMLSLRAEVEPLACGRTAHELVAAAGALDWAAARGSQLLAAGLSHVHERRGTAAARLPSLELRAALARAVGAPLPSAGGGGSAPAAGGGCAGATLVVVETDGGFLLGAATFAPASDAAARLAWARKPGQFCAGLPFELAALGVGLATRLRPRGAALEDPCCGSGTVLFAAACLGAASASGGDLEPRLVAMAAANLEATGGAARAEAARRRAGGGGAVAPPDCSVLLRCQDAFLAPPPAAPADALVCNLPFGRVVSVGGAGGGDVGDLLARLRPRASAHAFFSGAPIGPLLRDRGYDRVRELSVDATGRRWLSLCGAAGRAEE